MSIRRITRTNQPQSAVGVDWGNPIARGLAIAWTGADPRTNAASGTLASTNNTNAAPSPRGMARRSAAGQTNVEWDRQFLTTSDGAGGGDFTMLVFANPTAAGSGAVEHVFVQKNDAGGSPFSQAVLSAHADNGNAYLSGSFSFYTYNGSQGLAQAVHSPGACTGGWSVWVGRRANAVMSLWRDGISLVSASRSVSPITQSSPSRRTAIGSRGNGTTESYRSDALVALAWNRALTDAEIASISANPWQLFAPIQQPIFVPLGSGVVGGPTIYRPSSDISVSGWTPVGDTTVFGTINESSLDTADYSTSPEHVSAPAIMGLSAPMSAGNYDVRINAARVTTEGEIRVRFTDDSDVDVGGTDWQLLTATPTTYTLSATLSGTATRQKIEVR